jgi:DNA-binding MarR family transcriptional regulator
MEGMVNQRQAIRNLFETLSLGAPEKAVGFVLWRVVHRYIREVDRALADHDLTHLQFTTLAMAAWLGREGESVTQSEIARFSDIHPMQVSQMLKVLETKGMVKRERSPSDVRAKHIAITRSGIATLGRTMPVVIEVQRRLFGEAGKTGGSLLEGLLRVGEGE